MHNSLSGMMNNINNLKNQISISNAGDKYIVTLENKKENLKKGNEFFVDRLNNTLLVVYAFPKQ